MATDQATQDQTHVSDGRRLRSERNKQKIVSAAGPSSVTSRCLSSETTMQPAVGTGRCHCDHVEANGLRQFRAGLVWRSVGRHHIHRGSHAHGQQPHQFILRLRQQRGEQFGTVLGQRFTRDLLQFAQRHSGG